MNTNIEQIQLEYYRQRAAEYEQIYTDLNDPRFKQDTADMAERLRKIMRGRHVLEVACGTGYWSALLGEVAAQVVATDAVAEVLAEAHKLGRARDNVRFVLADAFGLSSVAGTFDAALAMFWFSHIPKARIADFFASLHQRLGSGAIVCIADDIAKPEVGHVYPAAGSDDTYQARTLANGSQHTVVKNLYTEAEVLQLLQGRADSIKSSTLNYCWWVCYEVAE